MRYLLFLLPFLFLLGCEDEENNPIGSYNKIYGLNPTDKSGIYFGTIGEVNANNTYYVNGDEYNLRPYPNPSSDILIIPKIGKVFSKNLIYLFLYIIILPLIASFFLELCQL